MAESYEVESIVQDITFTKRYGLLKLEQHCPVDKKATTLMTATL